METIFKVGSKHEKIIHENFKIFVHHIRKNGQDTMLKYSGCIVEPERHSSESEIAIGASEGDFLLVIREYRYLIVPQIII